MCKEEERLKDYGEVKRKCENNKRTTMWWLYSNHLVNIATETENIEAYIPHNNYLRMAILKKNCDK